MQKELRGSRIAHKSQRRRGGSDQADVSPGKPEQQTNRTPPPSPGRRAGNWDSRRCGRSRPQSRRCLRSSPTSPTCFMARDSSTSPVTEAVTMTRIAPQRIACFMAHPGRSQSGSGSSRGGVSQLRALRDEAYADRDQQNAHPAHRSPAHAGRTSRSGQQT